MTPTPVTVLARIELTKSDLELLDRMAGMASISRDKLLTEYIRQMIAGERAMLARYEMPEDARVHWLKPPSRDD